MPALRAAAAAARLTDDNMTALGSAERVFSRPYEGQFRAAALVIDGETRLCLIGVDALVAPSAVVSAAAARIAAATAIPVENVLICATHTHTAPGTIDILGFTPNREFLRRIEEACVQAARSAWEDLDAAPEQAEAELLLGVTQEATVGRNSRLLLKDGTVGWYGYEASDVVRPTGPYDPDLHVIAVKRRVGGYAGIVLNHSVHNIGGIREGALSPGFYGLSAQEIERRHGATALFLPGAFGSTHNKTHKNSGVPAAECVKRVVAAVEVALAGASPAPAGPVRVLNRPFTYRVREFDEDKEAAAVKYYMEKYAPADAAAQVEVFRQGRAELARLRGEEGQTRLMAVRLGDIALVGVPGEMFAKLGLDLRQRSPFPHTCVVGLANEPLGYIPDRQAYADGGYQTWPAGHSVMAVGTGEVMVDQALDMLEELRRADSATDEHG